MSAQSKVRFALIGAGAIAGIHARAITSLPETAELRVVVSTRDETARLALAVVLGLYASAESGRPVPVPPPVMAP